MPLKPHDIKNVSCTKKAARIWTAFSFFTDIDFISDKLYIL